MNINQLCMKCMIGKLNEEGKCTCCGATDSSEKNGSLHLPVRSILKGKYLIGRVIGEGGFGITYIGFDLDLEVRVAIKEFCPKQYVGREAEDGLTIYPYNEKDAEFFENEKQKFINEARRLAKFRNEGGVVSVLDYFIENGTAYIVMDYIDGITLKSYLKTWHNTTGKNMTMSGVLKLFRPVMETLAKIHNDNIIHRDISPENIMISNDFNKVYLIDFGTARDIADGHTLSEYSKSFYTPIEQMSDKMKQGPWTDVYALCATIYVCITGRTLPESVSRLLEDDLIGPGRHGADISENMEAVLIKGLAVKPEDRIQSMEELMQALYEGEFDNEQKEVCAVEEDTKQVEYATEKEQTLPKKTENEIPDKDIIKYILLLLILIPICLFCTSIIVFLIIDGIEDGFSLHHLLGTVICSGGLIILSKIVSKLKKILKNG